MKRLVSVLLSLIILSVMTPGVFAASDEAINAANALYSLNLFRGTGIDDDGNPIFELDRSPNRNEAITMLIRLLNMEQEALNGEWDAPFTDMDEWAAPYIGCAYAYGLTNGTSSNTYSGDEKVTATQYLTFVLRALDYDSSTDFKWDRAWELSNLIGLTNGEFDDNTQEFTRGNVAIVSYNALQIPMKSGGQTLYESLFWEGENYSPSELAQFQAAGIIQNTLDQISIQPGSDHNTYPYEMERMYDSLTESQQSLYNEILSKVLNLEDFEYTEEEYGQEVLNDIYTTVYAAIVHDYPETDIYFIVEDVLDGDYTVGMKSRYFMPYDSNMTIVCDKTALRKELRVFDEVCNLVIENMPEKASAYDKYRYLAAYISNTTEYDYNFIGGPELGNAYGSISGGLSICQGYSKGFEYLCRKANLWCRCVDGIVNDESHMWNLVKLDGGTYYIDITWCDNGINTPADVGWYDYFMITQEQLIRDHTITDGTVATGTEIPIIPIGLNGVPQS